jgi:hypothetical protein
MVLRTPLNAAHVRPFGPTRFAGSRASPSARGYAPHQTAGPWAGLWALGCPASGGSPLPALVGGQGDALDARRPLRGTRKTTGQGSPSASFTPACTAVMSAAGNAGTM